MIDLAEIMRRYNHLRDDEPSVFVPYLGVGHYASNDPAASPVVAEWLADDEELPPHPYSGKPMVLVRLDDGRQLLVAIDRLVHSGKCAGCAAQLKPLEKAVRGLPEGGMLSAVMEVQLVDGPVLLVVDAMDMEDQGLGEWPAWTKGGPEQR